jgi:hypothetical protein
MAKYQIEMVKEYKVLPPMDEKAVEATINSCAIDGWQVFVARAPYCGETAQCRCCIGREATSGG